MRTRSIILLVLALACGTVATVGISQVMERNRTSPDLEMAQIFVALTDINYGEKFTPQNVKLEDWPKSKVPQGSFTKFEEFDKQQAKYRISSGQPILQSLTADHLQGAVTEIPRGFQVVSVAVDQVSAVSNLIMPGNFVDVLVHLKKSQENNISQTTVRRVLKGIKVFNVGTVTQIQSAKDNAALAAQSVGLLVTSKQAEVVTLVSSLGQIRLVLCANEDAPKTEAEQNVDLSDILPNDGHSPRQFAAAPPAPSAMANLIELFKSRGNTTPPNNSVAPAPQLPTPPARTAQQAPPANSFRMMIIEGNEVKEMDVPIDGGSAPVLVTPVGQQNNSTAAATPAPQPVLSGL
jgi:pilus assembly protein CpaB